MQTKLLTESAERQELTPEFLRSQGLNETAPDRFWGFVEKTNGCWRWRGHKTEKGYGRIGMGGRGASNTGAHRVSWIIHYGPIPNGMSVLHQCDNPECTRPDHLWLGTVLDNNLDMHEKHRQATGEKVGSRLTSRDILVIRFLYRAIGHRQKDIGGMFGVNQTCVSKIMRRELFKHIPG